MKTSVKILLGIIIALALAVFTLGKCNRSFRSENNRLQNNNDALMEDVVMYMDIADHSAASIQMLELSKKELEKNYQDVCQRAKDLGLQVKRLQAASKTETQTKIPIQTVVKDSIIYVNGVLDSLKRIEWRDPWVNVEGTLKRIAWILMLPRLILSTNLSTVCLISSGLSNGGARRSARRSPPATLIRKSPIQNI